MKTPTRLMATIALAMTGNVALAAENHTMLDTLHFSTLSVDELEWRGGDGDDALHWNAELFHGSDLHRFGIETEGAHRDGATTEADVELLYRRAIAPFWDLKTGWRSDIQPQRRDWFAIGIDGLVPYGIDAEAMLYVGAGGRALLDLKLGYELLLTQRLVLEPELTFGFSSEKDRDTDTGSGLTGTQASLRLRYEITRKFAPYVGVIWQRASGDSAELISAGSGDPERTQIVIGLRFWL